MSNVTLPSHRKRFEWIEEFEEVLRPIKNSFQVYEKLLLDGEDTGELTFYNHTFRMMASGEVSTYFVFGRHHNVTVGQNDDIE